MMLNSSPCFRLRLAKRLRLGTPAAAALAIFRLAYSSSAPYADWVGLEVDPRHASLSASPNMSGRKYTFSNTLALRHKRNRVKKSSGD